MGSPKTTEVFIKQAKELHKNRYSYENVVYKMNRVKVNIICPKHGSFWQTPSAHLAGQNCPQCGRESLKAKCKLKTKTTEKFVEEANKVHNYKYDYANTTYTTAKKDLTVTCLIHGDFTVRATNHLHGLGCTKCTPKGYSDTTWSDKASLSKHFDSFKVYIIECQNDNEHFIKIGKTFKTVGKRFSNTHHMPYEWKLLYQKEGSYKYISNLERSLHSTFGEYLYSPILPFSGDTECFTIEVKEQFSPDIFD